MRGLTTNNIGKPMNCEQVLKGDVAEKYVLSQLSVAGQEAFEQHYFECERCFEELQTCRGLQVALNETSRVMHTEPIEEPVRWRWTWGLTIALVLLTLGFMLWSRRPALGPSPPLAVTPPTRVAPAEVQVQARSNAQQPSTAQSPVPTRSELAQFQPPPYVPSTLRGAEDDANGKFREAMEYYIRGEYASSIPTLIAASQLDPKAANISFFLGICYLLTGRTDAAIEALRKTVALGDSPYLEEGYFYLAKALIREGDLNGARRELRETIQLRGELEQRAQGLLGQLQVAGRDQH